MSGPLKFMLIVSDPGMAAFAHEAGVERLFVDLEVMGKAARQGHLDSWKSETGLEDLSAIRAAVPGADILVRINPLHEGTGAEIDAVIARGASRVMLPMFRHAHEVAQFHDLLAGRVPSMPLVETLGALAAIPQIIETCPPAELYFGLNDLHLDAGHRFMFEPLARGMLEAPTAALRNAQIPFGIGGVARVGTGALRAENILGEHARLGSEWVILSRGFHGRASNAKELEAMDFAGEMTKLRAAHAGFATAGAAVLEANRVETWAQIEALAKAQEG